MSILQLYRVNTCIVVVRSGVKGRLAVSGVLDCSRLKLITTSNCVICRGKIVSVKRALCEPLEIGRGEEGEA